MPPPAFGLDSGTNLRKGSRESGQAVLPGECTRDSTLGGTPGGALRTPHTPWHGGGPRVFGRPGARKRLRGLQRKLVSQHQAALTSEWQGLCFSQLDVERGGLHQRVRGWKEEDYKEPQDQVEAAARRAHAQTPL